MIRNGVAVLDAYIEKCTKTRRSVSIATEINELASTILLHIVLFNLALVPANENSAFVFCLHFEHDLRFANPICYRRQSSGKLGF